MSVSYSKFVRTLQRIFALFITVAIVSSMVPPVVFAEESDVPVADTEENTQASSTEDTTIPEEGVGGEAPTSTSTSTDPENTTDGGTASSTEGGTDGEDSGSGGSDGTDAEGGTLDGDTSTTTATSTATSTPPVGEGTPGDEGVTGEEGAQGEVEATPEADGDPVEVESDPLLNDIDAPEEEDITGDITRSGRNSRIETGTATAQGELYTDANSNDVQSLFEGTITDFDTYTFTASSTNEAVVQNDGAVLSSTGDNAALASSLAEVYSGKAVSAFNAANVINTNVVNSEGLIYLGNKILNAGESLNLTDSFFPDGSTPGVCNLLSCAAEDVVYNFSQLNHATVTTEAVLEANSGENVADGNVSNIATGDAYGSANVINVVNTNIIDSQYKLLTFNAIGDLEGDLILPTEELFDAFFAHPNGLNQLESGEASSIVVDNTNDGTVENNLDTYGQTGNNDSSTSFDAVIRTGRSETESNIVNKINENTYGGDLMYMLIKVHGSWSGEVVGLPSGLTWEWTPDGIIIYNIDAEIAPSQFLGYDVDTYAAHIVDDNDVHLENNITIKAITGENDIDGLAGSIDTGDAFASANVMNIANTNVIGTNWTFAVINILGDFEGNISFNTTDLALAGTVSSPHTPARQGDLLTYTYTITNNTNSTASGIELTQTLDGAHTQSNEIDQMTNVGSLAAHASKQVVLKALVDQDIPQGTTTPVIAYASVSSDQGDVDFADNLLMLTVNATYQNSNTPTTTPPGGNSTSTNNTGTTTTTNTNNPPVYSQGSYSSGGGGGGGGSSSKKKKIEREVTKVDPNKPPLVVITKEAIGIDADEVVTAGDSVDYKITVTNSGGKAYDGKVFDVLKNPIGSVVNEQSWDLGTILPGEKIDLTYTTEYSPMTPSGSYTNTARVVAYLKDGMKEAGEDPLTIQNAVHTIEVKGLDLGIGNVEVLAYFPGTNGQTSALVAWETSKPSLSQMFYGLTQFQTPYDPKAQNFGYTNASFKFPTEKTRHTMIINNLLPGFTHSYRIHAQSGKYLATSREYTFTVPAAVPKLTLATPTSGAPVIAPTPILPVAATSFVSSATVYSKTTAAAKVTPPAPKPVVETQPAAVAAASAVTVQPEQKQSGIGGFVQQVKSTLFGLFR